jgi:hypothetical protein
MIRREIMKKIINAFTQKLVTITTPDPEKEDSKNYSREEKATLAANRKAAVVARMEASKVTGTRDCVVCHAIVLNRVLVDEMCPMCFKTHATVAQKAALKAALTIEATADVAKSASSSITRTGSRVIDHFSADARTERKIAKARKLLEKGQKALKKARS